MYSGKEEIVSLPIALSIANKRGTVTALTFLGKRGLQRCNCSLSNVAGASFSPLIRHRGSPFFRRVDVHPRVIFDTQMHSARAAMQSSCPRLTGNRPRDNSISSANLTDFALEIFFPLRVSACVLPFARYWLRGLLLIGWNIINSLQFNRTTIVQ